MKPENLRNRQSFAKPWKKPAAKLPLAPYSAFIFWIHPQTRQQYLRIAYVGSYLSHDESRVLDDGVYAVHWFTPADLQQRMQRLRSPLVMRCVEDYQAGLRKSDSFLSGLMPLQQNVAAVMANARARLAYIYL